MHIKTGLLVNIFKGLKSGHRLREVKVFLTDSPEFPPNEICAEFINDGGFFTCTK